MAGHSKWAQIKRQKAATDAQKSKEFAKLLRKIAAAVKEAGPDPNANLALRTAIEKASRANIPSSNIERAIERAKGAGKDTLENVLFEAYGPAGAAILVEGVTDSKNRTSQEIKHILSEHGAKLAGLGSARFLFQKTADGWEPVTPLPVDAAVKESLTKLFEALDASDDVTDIFTNADL
ncbi:MAG: YebC/PmpR family DNA-binding transcriptional regulator [Candidatus Niyogibacteria bacterium]|nr:YebC/PmpR family DNA-binding transcriptional regulator [Candidatus Niyogibacteria bacterium]